jgi:hypothetical protein
MRNAAIVVLSLMFFASCASQHPARLENDEDWNRFADELRERPPQEIAHRLAKALPEVTKFSDADSCHRHFAQLWGLALNFDEHAKGVIVAKPIIHALSALAAVASPSEESEENRIEGDVVHAGIQHSFGYLLSTLHTPFGYKRARWIYGEIERGFALPIGLLRPASSDGDFFCNVSFLMAKLARFKRLPPHHEGVAKALYSLNFEKLGATRIEEVVHIGSSRTVFLRTDLIAFQRQGEKDANSHLLVYSVLDSEVDEPRLISAFPVGPKMVGGLLAGPFGDDVLVTTRYNAFVPGVSGRQQAGSRRIVQ